MTFESVNAQHALGLAAGGLSSFFWTVTYALVIARGRRDRTFGMPLAALCANLAWELIFLCDTIAIGAIDERLAMIVPWTLLDFAIVWQCFAFGPDDFRDPRVRRWFRPALVVMLGLAGGLVWTLVRELHDAIGWQVAFGQNLMMSILFVAMVLRREDVRGQSMYIGLAKLLGSLFAFVLALFWSPRSLHEHWAKLLPDAYHPIAPLLVTLYCGIFLFDVLYVVLLWLKHRDLGLDPWRWGPPRAPGDARPAIS